MPTTSVGEGLWSEGNRAEDNTATAAEPILLNPDS